MTAGATGARSAPSARPRRSEREEELEPDSIQPKQPRRSFFAAFSAADTPTKYLNRRPLEDIPAFQRAAMPTAEERRRGRQPSAGPASGSASEAASRSHQCMRQCPVPVQPRAAWRRVSAPLQLLRSDCEVKLEPAWSRGAVAQPNPLAVEVRARARTRRRNRHPWPRRCRGPHRHCRAQERERLQAARPAPCSMPAKVRKPSAKTAARRSSKCWSKNAASSMCAARSCRSILAPWSPLTSSSPRPA